ncbi:MAG: hypothetical protein L0170_11870 [Acidobacteria bacterium]|nr:hypothetical protein [Acidobacteriota bacterium]
MLSRVLSSVLALTLLTSLTDATHCYVCDAGQSKKCTAQKVLPNGTLGPDIVIDHGDSLTTGGESYVLRKAGDWDHCPS